MFLHSPQLDFPQYSKSLANPLGGRFVLTFHQGVLANAVAQLVIGQPERPGGLALVPAMLSEGMGQNRAFVRIDCRAQILDGIEVDR